MTSLFPVPDDDVVSSPRVSEDECGPEVPRESDQLGSESDESSSGVLSVCTSVEDPMVEEEEVVGDGEDEEEDVGAADEDADVEDEILNPGADAQQSARRRRPTRHLVVEVSLRALPAQPPFALLTLRCSFPRCHTFVIRPSSFPQPFCGNALSSRGAAQRWATLSSLRRTTTPCC